jgi:hypothetical protein
MSARPRRDWLSKTLAGALLGLALGLGASLLLNLALQPLPLAVRGQLAMWSVAPVWLTVWSAVSLFASGAQAWRWLGAATLLLGGAGALLQRLMGG